MNCKGRCPHRPIFYAEKDYKKRPHTVFGMGLIVD